METAIDLKPFSYNDNEYIGEDINLALCIFPYAENRTWLLTSKIVSEEDSEHLSLLIVLFVKLFEALVLPG